MFVIDRRGDLVGFTIWEADDIYAPMVGCYHDGNLVEIAVCDRAPEPVALEGPGHRCWFRMRVASDILDALVQENGPKLLRTEDGLPIAFAATTQAVPPMRRAEDFLTTASRQLGGLDGFAAFLGAPLSHQVDVLFLDILGRLADPMAREHYVDVLRRGASVLDLRIDLLRSEEFLQRGVTVSHRLGSLITSSIWRTLADAEPLNERRTPVRLLRLGSYAALSDREFAAQVHLDCHGDRPDEAALNRLEWVAQTSGRRTVARLLVRDAANGGTFLDVIEA